MIKAEYKLHIDDYIRGIREFLLPLELSGVDIEVCVVDWVSLKVTVDKISNRYNIGTILSKTLPNVLYRIACDHNHLHRGLPDTTFLYFKQYKEEFNSGVVQTCAE